MGSEQNWHYFADDILKCTLLKEKCLPNFQICSRWSIWKHVLISASNGMVPSRLQATIWTNEGQFNDEYVRHKASMIYKIFYHHKNSFVVISLWSLWCSAYITGDKNNFHKDSPVHLTHWGRVTYICVSKLTIIGSDNGLSPDRRQAIIWTNAGILSIGPLGTNFSEIFIEILTFSCKKMRLKVSSAKWRPFCLGLNVLKHACT